MRFLIILMLLAGPALAAQEQILFILDFSGSMNETLHGTPKIELMLQTMHKILPKIDPNTPVGLRVYGHRGGFTAYEGCHASSLIAPAAPYNTENIEYALSKVKPRGMTPITYSLKQAVKNDFLGFTGKKHIILLTDGGENCDESPCKYVMELIRTRNDIFIDVIAFNVNNAEDLDQLQCTALVTRGKFYSANTAAELAKSMHNSVYKDVEAKILK